MSRRVARPVEVGIRAMPAEEEALERAADRRRSVRLVIRGPLAVATSVAILMPVEPASPRSVVVPSGKGGDPLPGGAR